jgi:hypothetical protein
MTTSNETKKLINELKNVESLKVVNIALELNKLQDKTTEELIINVVKTMDSNMKLLAVKVLELEKQINELDDTLARRINNERF